MRQVAFDAVHAQLHAVALEGPQHGLSEIEAGPEIIVGALAVTLGQGFFAPAVRLRYQRVQSRGALKGFHLRQDREAGPAARRLLRRIEKAENTAIYCYYLCKDLDRETL